MKNTIIKLHKDELSLAKLWANKEVDSIKVTYDTNEIICVFISTKGK